MSLTFLVLKILHLVDSFYVNSLSYQQKKYWSSHSYITLILVSLISLNNHQFFNTKYPKVTSTIHLIGNVRKMNRTRKKIKQKTGLQSFQRNIYMKI